MFGLGFAICGLLYMCVRGNSRVQELVQVKMLSQSPPLEQQHLPTYIRDVQTVIVPSGSGKHIYLFNFMYIKLIMANSAFHPSGVGK